MKITIVIVNYNSGEYLSRAVMSAVEYTSSNIVVVDNHSTDDSIEMARRNVNSRRVEWILNSENLGFAKANNQVLRRGTADFFLLMNPDCILSNDAAGQLAEYLKSNAEVGMASCRILNEDGTVQSTCRRRFPTPASAAARILMLDKLFPDNDRFRDFDYGSSAKDSDPIEYVEAVSGAFLMIRRETLNDIGLLDESYFMHCEDLDWCKRAQDAGWKTAFLPASSVIHIKGVSSSSRPIRVLWTLHKGMNRFFDKFYYRQYPWFTRLFVKIGIVGSFLLRATKTLLMGRRS